MYLSYRYETLVILSPIMGLSIYLSWPLIKYFKVESNKKYLIISVAVGISLFIMSDIFSEVSTIIYAGGNYTANFRFSAIFTLSVLFMFIVLIYLESPFISKRWKESRIELKIPLIISLGMGFQNLTEGLIFGAFWRSGLTGLSSVILVGFVLQNFTEGFPIVAPLMNSNNVKNSVIASLYFIGGTPTIMGGLIGYMHNSILYDLAFDGLATGSIIFVIIPMIKQMISSTENRKTNYI